MNAKKVTNWAVFNSRKSGFAITRSAGAEKMAEVFAGVINNMLSGIGCTDNAFLEFDPSATTSNTSLCLTTYTSAINFDFAQDASLEFGTRLGNLIRIYNLSGELVGKALNFTGSESLTGLMKKNNLKTGVYFIRRAMQPAKKIFLSN